MKENLYSAVPVEQLIENYPVLDVCREQIICAYERLKKVYEGNGKLLIAGNGGSAADAEHIAGELMKCFRRPRGISEDMKQKLAAIDSVRGARLAGQLERALPAIPLVSHIAVSTAYINDTCCEGVYAQQLQGYGNPGDCFLGITTSGNSENVINAAITAKAMGIAVIGLTGAGGGTLSRYTDICICVPEREVYRVQELHLPIYHCLCMMLEEHFFGGES